MKVITYDMYIKFGDRLESLVGSKEYSSEENETNDFGKIEEAVREAKGRSVLVLLHWNPGVRQRLISLLQQNETAYVLYLSGMHPDWNVIGGIRSEVGADRVAAFDRPVPTPCDDEFVWDKLCEFMMHAVDKQVPPWHLLKMNSVPEHVIACYLAVLTGNSQRVPEDWKDGFESEVSYIERQDEKLGKAVHLSWDDRKEPQDLRRFLKAARILAGGDD